MQKEVHHKVIVYTQSSQKAEELVELFKNHHIIECVVKGKEMLREKIAEAVQKTTILVDQAKTMAPQIQADIQAQT